LSQPASHKQPTSTRSPPTLLLLLELELELVLVLVGCRCRLNTKNPATENERE